jgi:hypothetical protein
MTSHRIATPLVTAGIALVLGVACGGDSKPTDSAYCKTARNWAVHELTAFDPSDAESTRQFFADYQSHINASSKDAPKDIEAPWKTNANAFNTLFMPMLERHGFSFDRVMREGSPEDQALLAETPADVAAAQSQIQAYDATVCGSAQPPAADVVYEGPAAPGYCEGQQAIDARMEELAADGFQPAAFRALVASPEFQELLFAGPSVAPPELQADEVAIEQFTRDRMLPLLERYDYDVRRLLLEGSPADRAVFQSADASIRDAFARTEAYITQLCAD